MSSPLLTISCAPPAGASGPGQLRDLEGQPCGYLHVSHGPETGDACTAKIDPGCIDSAGPPGWLSLVWEEGVDLPFDDVAISGAVRDRLRWGLSGRLAFVSTLTRGDDTFAGAISGVSRCTAEEAGVFLRDDPFARVLPRRLASYGPGLFGKRPAPAGPATQRYGSTTPWPSDRF